MSRKLVVELPEADQTASTIEAYHEFVVAKLNGEYDPDLNERYKTLADGDCEERLDDLEAGNEVSFMAYVPRDCSGTNAWDRFVSLFESDGGDIVRTIDDPAELEELIAILRSMKTDLKEQSAGDPRMDTTPEEWEIMFETGLITLPEFAREHGYGVWAPY